MNKGLSIKVGMFVIIGFILLSVFSLMSEGFKKLKGTYIIKTHFKEVSGLTEGDYVLLAGVHIGYVDKIRISEDYKDVTLDLRIFKDKKVTKDAVARVDLISIMGLKSINISIGDLSSGYAEPGDTIESLETVELSEMIANVNKTTDSAKEFIDSLNENQNEIASKVKEILDENRDNIKNTITSLSESSPKLQDTIASINDMVASVNNGEGTIGRLFKDDSLYKDVTDFFDSTNELVSQVKKGEGTLGKLLYDDYIYIQATETLESIEKTSISLNDLINNNENDITNVIDTIKKFSSDMSETAETFKEVAENIKQGKGTIGKLVTDDALYTDARKAISRIDDTFEESQEQSVIKTFIGVFF